MINIDPFIFAPPPILVLNMQFEGPNSSTTFVDDAGRHSPILVPGGSTAQIRTTTGMIPGNGPLAGTSSLLSSTGTSAGVKTDTAGSNSDFIWTGNFSISFLVCRVGVGALRPWIVLTNNDTADFQTGNTSGCWIGRDSSGIYVFDANNNVLGFVADIPAGKRTRVTYSRTGTTATLSKLEDGGSLVSSSWTQNGTVGNGNLYVGGTNYGTFAGNSIWIDDLQVIKG